MTTIGINIATITSGEFIYFLYPSEVTLGDSATFDTTFENIGNINITVEIEIHVKDSSLNTVASFYDDNYTLRLRDTRNFSATWTPTATGTYWVIVNASYNSSVVSNTTEENASFDVVAAAAVPVVEAPAGGGIPVKVITYNLTLEYPESMDLTLGESSIIPVYATNYGETDLNNLLLSVSLEDIEWEIQPENVSVLPANSTVIFYISVLVPSDALSKDYTLDLTLKSDEITESGQIIITVYPVDLCLEVERAINNYESLIDRLTAEIEKAISEGRNVSSTLAYLLNAKGELELAKQAYEANDCGEAKTHLELVRENLKEAVSELATSIKSKVKFVVIGTWWIIGIILFIIALMILFIIIAKRRKKVKYVTKPMIIVLKEKREKHKKDLRDLKRSYNKKQISEKTYNRKKTEIEREIIKVEEQILRQFGSERQKIVFKDLKKAYTEGIINKKTYNSTREKLVNNIISKQAPKR